MRLTVPPYVVASAKSTPGQSAELEVEPRRVHNPPAPLPQMPLPSLKGNPIGRPWGNWAARQLVGGGSGLYMGMPVLEQLDDSSWAVRHEYLKTGSTSEAAVLKYPGIPEWGGARGDAMTAGNMTPIGIANKEGDTLWLGSSAAGGVWHVTSRATFPLFGPALLPDAVVRPNGKGKTHFGTFDRPLFNPNDLALDESLIPSATGTTFMKTVVFIADTGTVKSQSGRIAKLEHTASGTPSERHVALTTYADLRGMLPYGLVRWPDGTLIFCDRASGKVYVAKPNGQKPVEYASGLGECFRLDRFSDESLLVADWAGNRNLTEIGPTGVKRDQGKVWSKQGYPASDFYYEVYVDRTGAQGPVDDIFTLGYGTGRSIQRRGRTDGYGQMGATNASDGSWLVPGSATIRQGAVSNIQEIDWHYGWGLAGSPTEPKFLMCGDAGTGGMTEVYFPPDALMAEFRKFDKTLYNRGRTVWSAGTTPEAGVPRPSGWLTMGIYGQNFVHGYTFDQIADRTPAEFAAWARAGMGTLTPRPEMTAADCRALHYYAWCHSIHAQRTMSPTAIAGGPPPPPPPPADTAGPVLTVTGWPAAPAATVSLTVEAVDPAGVAFVALFVDGEEVGRDTTGPAWTFAYEFPAALEPGPHAFVIAGEDTKGNRTTLAAVEVSKPLPPPTLPDVELRLLTKGLTYVVTES